MKQKNLLIIAAIIIIFLIVKKPGVTQLGVVDKDTEAQCDQDRQECRDDNWPCCAPCVEITNDIINCYESKTNGDNWLSSEIQEWAYVYSSLYTCDDYYTKMTRLYKAIYECFYLEGNGGDCNTNADTDCDGCVTDIEFPQATNKWLNQAGISDSDFPTIVTNWLNQNGC